MRLQIVVIGLPSPITVPNGVACRFAAAPGGCLYAGGTTAILETALGGRQKGVRPGCVLRRLPRPLRLVLNFLFECDPVQDELLYQAAEHALAGGDKEILEH